VVPVERWKKIGMKRRALRREGQRISDEIMKSNRQQTVTGIVFHSVTKFET
jgi:hypothetical protein